MICKNCGKEVRENDMFCTECGTKIEQADNIQTNKIDQNVVQSTTINSGSVAVKKKYPTKLVVIIVIIALIGIVVLSIASGDSVIIENEECQLGATYTFTPEEFIERYNSTIELMEGDNSLFLPDINEWIEADLLSDGDICYTYPLSADLSYCIYTYQNDKVNQFYIQMSDDLQVQSGIMMMTICEAAATGLTDEDSISTMFDIMRDNLLESPFNYNNSLVNFGDDGIILSPVSDEKLETIDYYDILDSDL